MSPISSRKDSAVAARKSASLHLSADYSVCYLGGPHGQLLHQGSFFFRLRSPPDLTVMGERNPSSDDSGGE